MTYRQLSGIYSVRLPRDWVAHVAMEWVSEGGSRNIGRPTKTWRSTLLFNENLAELEIKWNDAKKQLRLIVVDGEISSPDVQKGTERTKSKYKSLNKFVFRVVHCRVGILVYTRYRM